MARLDGASCIERSMRIIVAGTGMRGGGYPNATNTIRILREHGGWQVDDQARWLPEGMALWKSASGSRAKLLTSLCRLLGSNLLAVFRLLATRGRHGCWVYAPYPAIFLLWWLSWVPRSARPRVVADAYVSLWDSAFRDRSLGAAKRWPAQLARWFEGRALRAASMVFVDTTANRDWMVEEFGISPARIHAVPLAIDERVFSGCAESGHRGCGESLRVVYLGTLVPLHGIEVVVDAVGQLAGDSAFKFTFVGDGQQAAALERLVNEPQAGIAWSREWLSESGVAELLGQADLSFGVFGGGAKASRVLPLKVYLSLAAGTPVLTQDRLSLPEGVPVPPLFVVQPTPQEIVRKLSELSANRSLLEFASQESRRYFSAHLGPDSIVSAWSRWIGPDRDERSNC
jgi:glycosyltransferase involved in cell wall biosynthesis